MATYYVDSGAGSDSHNGLSPLDAWKSLDSVNARVFEPGDRVLLRCGTRFAGQLKPQGSGATSDGVILPITLGKYGDGPRPRIDGEGKYPQTLHLYNVAGWEIRDLEITNAGAERQARRKGVFLELRDFGTARHIRLDNLFVHDVNGSNIKKEGGGAGIEWSVGGRDNKSRFDGLTIENCRLLRCDRNGIVGGGYWQRTEWFPSLHVAIRSNVLEDIGGDGIVPIACDGALVEKNTLRGCGGRIPEGDAAAGIWPWSCDNTVVQFNEVSGQTGPWDAQGFDADWNCRNTLIQYNYSHDNEGGFLLVCNDGNSKPPGNAGNLGTVVRYNVSVHDGFRTRGKHAGFSPTFHVSGPCANTRIYNNTIIVGPRPPGADETLVKMDTWGGWSSDTVFTNNLFVAEGRVDYEYGQASGTVFENNGYAGTHANAPSDARAIRAMPRFRDRPNNAAGAERFRPRPDSPGVAAGKRIPDAGARDFAGKTLPAARPPSLGALEPER